MAEIVVEKGDITLKEAGAIVNPANSGGWMGGGVAYAIKKAGGDIIEAEAVASAPIPVGSAVETSAGKLPCKHVIHAPTMELPGEIIGPENVNSATDAALRKASELGVESVAFPGMGCGVGGLSKSVASRAMVESILDFGPEFTVYLIGFDDELTEEFRGWLRQNQGTG
ncbi:MAG: macro domain-containing protein [Candidatus Altiarchaeales archaeon]|nr:macro domain-containing protein [Candidatus Altiarchaeales archaeon]MBD3416768.1 macro domain-containing protein [Candidatus Altiarchaeales archaeon]